MDLEGRGTSLQDTVQAEAETLKQELPKGLPQGLPGSFERVIPGAIPTGDATRAEAREAPRQQTGPKVVLPGQHDEKLVH